MQSGKGFPVFQGYRGQRGHGLGSLLSGWFRSALPLLKRGLSFFGKQALNTGAKIATDVVAGKAFGESAKNRVVETINEHAPGLIPQSGSGHRRRRVKRQTRPRKAAKHARFLLHHGSVGQKRTRKRKRRSVKQGGKAKRRRRHSSSAGRFPF